MRYTGSAAVCATQDGSFMCEERSIRGGDMKGMGAGHPSERVSRKREVSAAMPHSHISNTKRMSSREVGRMG